MISNILIENYALISGTEISLNAGFSAITGETGAGKSILLGALGLVVGNRADISVLRDKTKKCIVELTCDISKYNLESFFAENDIDYDEQSIIRREISPKGKSRAFINDSPVSIKTLKDLGSNLIDIHSQHQTQTLVNKDYQLNVVDCYADIIAEISAYNQQYKEYIKLEAELQKLIEIAERESSDTDYFQFQFKQLDESQLVSNEQQELEEEQEILLHSEEIKTALVSSYNIIDNEEMSLLKSLKQAENQINKISAYSKQAKEISERLNSTYIELQDISFELEKQSISIEYDSSRTEWVNDRLSTIYSLQHKHKVESVDELIKLKDILKERLQNISSYDGKIQKLEKKIKAIKTELLEKAENISLKRVENIPEMENSMDKMLKELGINNAKFKIKIEKTDLNATGKDKVKFLFSGNKNYQLQELGRVASGGEMSRLMLSLKYLICKSKQLTTVIFDEIDAGVSGEIADRMAIMMQEMSKSMQIISITHLPQIASKGDWHYKVYKVDDEESTYSRIELLDKESRLKEIAQMLSGANITEAAYDNAKVLLNN